MNMTSNCDVTNSAHQMQIYHHLPLNEPPMKIFCVRHWAFTSYFLRKVSWVIGKSSLAVYTFV